MRNQISNENIGKRIARLRKNLHLTQLQLADLIGSTSKHISEIERGVTGISIDTQVLLSEQLHCSLDYLVKGEDFKSVDALLPSGIIKILNSQNAQEISLLLDYLRMYERIHKTDID